MKFKNYLYQKVENSDDEESNLPPQDRVTSQTNTISQKFCYFFVALVFVVALYISVSQLHYFSSNFQTKKCEFYMKSTKYFPECSLDNTKSSWPLLISATPRSGTVRTQTLLKELGFDITDDWGNPGKHGTVSWILAFRDSPEGYFGPVHITKKQSFEHVLHQIRDPLASITSIAYTEPWHKKNYFNFVHRHVNLGHPALNETIDFSNEMRISFALRMWVQYHEFLDKIADFHFKMEELSIDMLKKIIQISNFTMPSENLFQKLKFEKVVNARKHKEKITWKELEKIDSKFTKRAQNLARKYDYNSVDENLKKF